MISKLLLTACCIVTVGIATPALAQSIEILPGVRIGPPEEVQREAPPPREFERRGPERRERRDSRWEAVRERMAEFREGCERGDRRDCVNLGIMIGENKERRADWSREHPEMFSWERDRR